MRQNLRLSGVFGVLMIIGMFVLAFVLEWHIPWLYFIAAIVLYAVAILVTTKAEEENPDVILGDLFRWFLGCHLALLFLAAGLLIHFQDALTTYPPYKPDAGSAVVYMTFYFVVSVLGGLAIPFLVLKRTKGKHASNFNGILAFLLIILMIGIAVMYNWKSPGLYFLGAIIPYVIATLVLNNNDEVAEFHNQPKSKDVRFRIGLHLAFIFLLVGFWLHSDNGAVYIGFFIGGIAGGLVIPYLVVRGNPKSKNSSRNSIDEIREPGD